MVQGLLFGLVLQLSVGPVCLSVWQRSLRSGFRQALLMVLGVAIVDGAYMAAALWGMTRFLHDPLIKPFAQAGGAAVLIWFGLRERRSRGTNRAKGVQMTAWWLRRIVTQRAKQRHLPTVLQPGS
ncbi:LysE family translocator [Brevibacillus borstelensis]|uniref:LysE family translocator n=1 Tax=Brevibacillus borstelensis TaxID=45462 RepID=UPI0030C5E9D3